jgi:hypothetical protein
VSSAEEHKPEKIVSELQQQYTEANKKNQPQGTNRKCLTTIAYTTIET